MTQGDSCSDGTMGQRSWERYLCQTWGIQGSIQQEVVWISDLKREQELSRWGENRKNVLGRKKEMAIWRPRRWKSTVLLKNWKIFGMTKNERCKVRSAKSWGWGGKRGQTAGALQAWGLWSGQWDQKALSYNMEDGLRGSKTRENYPDASWWFPELGQREGCWWELERRHVFKIYVENRISRNC